MPSLDFLNTFYDFFACITNALVFSISIKYYKKSRIKPLLLLAISAGLGVFLSIMPYLGYRNIASDSTSIVLPYAYIALGMLDMVLWTLSTILIIQLLFAKIKSDNTTDSNSK